MKKLFKYSFITSITVAIISYKISTKYVKSYRNQIKDMSYITKKPLSSVKEPFPED